ncbi:MAG: hypothetical protein JRI36_10705 [Deltaproteobacteria bacterium]|nr:hypothetical protein [Deltaproteobacteria bacterium]
MEKLKAVMPGPAVGPSPGEPSSPGGLCLIQSSLAGWSAGGEYYNPPLVLVLDFSNAPVDHMLVAQTYHDVSLAAPGDLILTDEHSPVGELFIECWNTYTLRPQDLAGPVTFVSQQVLDSVRTLQSQPAAYPDWAMHPRPMTQHDVRLYFRKMEVEVGFFFSSQAVAALMDEVDLETLLGYGSVSELRDAITKVSPGVAWADPGPHSLDEALVLANFPDERLPLAAAEPDQETVTAKIVTVKTGAIWSFEPVPTRIIAKSGQDDALTISGQIVGLPPAKPRRLLCVWVDPGGTPRRPEDLSWDETTGHFLVSFSGADPARGHMELVCLCELAEG